VSNMVEYNKQAKQIKINHAVDYLTDMVYLEMKCNNSKEVPFNDVFNKLFKNENFNETDKYDIISRAEQLMYARYEIMIGEAGSYKRNRNRISFMDEDLNSKKFETGKRYRHYEAYILVKDRVDNKTFSEITVYSNVPTFFTSNERNTILKLRVQKGKGYEYVFVGKDIIINSINIY